MNMVGRLGRVVSVGLVLLRDLVASYMVLGLFMTLGCAGFVALFTLVLCCSSGLERLIGMRLGLLGYRLTG